MKKFLVVGDLHLADRPPAGRVDDYRQTALNKMRAISSICRNKGVELVVQLGDWFHLKQPNRTSHRLVREVIEVCQEFPCPIWTIRGNHDIAPNERIEGQPLGVLQKAGVVEVLEEARLWGSVLFIPRPWCTKEDANPSYYQPTAEELAFPAQYRVMVAHGSVVNPGNRRPFPFVDVCEIPGIEQIDMMACGHLHENLGLSVIPGLGRPVMFANPGSIMRVSRNQASYSRKVQVLTVTVEKASLEADFIDIPVAPAVQVFGAKELKPNGFEPNEQIQAFLAQLGEGLRADALTLDELLATVNVEDEVKSLIKRLLEEALT